MGGVEEVVSLVVSWDKAPKQVSSPRRRKRNNHQDEAMIGQPSSVAMLILGEGVVVLLVAVLDMAMLRRPVGIFFLI